MTDIRRYADALWESYLHMERLWGDYAKKHGETYLSLSVLDLLFRRGGGITAKELSEELLLPKQTVASIIADFERRGLASARPAPHDRRARICTLTDTGRAYCDGIIGTLNRIEERCLAEFTRDELEAACAFCKRYENAFAASMASELEAGKETLHG